MSQDERDEDIEDSLITQFETTLSIRPSVDAHAAEDITIDHSSIFAGGRHDGKSSQHLSNSLAVGEINECKADITSSSEVANEDQRRAINHMIDRFPELRNVLEPSKAIDLSLSRFSRTFTEFLKANPSIKSQSPRFDDDSDRTLVLLSPFSTEHAFGRSWVSKSYLSTIFERPQRLLATCIGVSAALTMYPFFYSIKNSDKKGSIFSKHVTKVHGKEWPTTLFNLCLESHEKLINGKLEVPPEWNPGDIYLTPKSITALEGVIGTIETAVDDVLGAKAHKLAFVVLRPPGHHSHASLPSGFCVFNNAQIGVEYAYQKHGMSHCAIFDIDLHHGDGTQDICWERAGFFGDHGKEDSESEADDVGENQGYESGESARNEHGKRSSSYPKVGYFSLHDIKSYPTEVGFASKENIKNASVCVMDHDLSIWNVHLQEWYSEDEFFKQYQTKYVALLNRANQFFNQAKKQHEADTLEFQEKTQKYNKFVQKPHLFKHPVARPIPPPQFNPLIIMSTGLDASEYENPQMQRHGINVPTSFYARFTKDVVKLAKLHTRGRVISFLEGGYSDGALISGTFSHLIGLTNNQRGTTDDPVLWNATWGTEQVVRELVKGCKRVWQPYKNPRTEVTIWATEVIKIGRSLMPQSILPANLTYSTVVSHPPEAHDTQNKTLREILENRNVPVTGDEDQRENTRSRVLRTTRDVYK